MLFLLIGELIYLLILLFYGFYWFYLVDVMQMLSWYVVVDECLLELLILVVKQCFGELLQGVLWNILEGEMLLVYLLKCCWFVGEKGQLWFCYIVLLDEVELCCVLCEVEIDGLCYQLLLGFFDVDQCGDSLFQLLVLVCLWCGCKVGLLIDVVSLLLFVCKVFV